MVDAGGIGVRLIDGVVLCHFGVAPLGRVRCRPDQLDRISVGVQTVERNGDVRRTAAEHTRGDVARARSRVLFLLWKDLDGDVPTDFVAPGVGYLIRRV